jgi:hypothetical protein
MRLLLTALIVLASPGLVDAGASDSVFKGEISDSQCAMNVHSLTRSHEEMIRKQTIGRDAASCARECVRRGGEWVLRSGQKVYRLKNQAGINEFAGQPVKVMGTLDRTTSTIDNTQIEFLSGPPL